MTVKEFMEVVPYSLIDYAKICERHWNLLFKSYDNKYTGERVNSKKDLEPYLDYKLDYFDYKTMYGEYDNSTIYIKMPKPNYQNGQEIECPCCGEKIVIEFDTARCDVCDWMCADAELDDIMEE